MWAMPSLEAKSSSPLQDEVLDKLDRTYYKKVRPAKLQDDAVRGLLQGLDDPYTHYLDPKEYTYIQERIERVVLRGGHVGRGARRFRHRGVDVQGIARRRRLDSCRGM